MGFVLLIVLFYVGLLVFYLSNVKIRHHNINEYFIYGRKLSGLNLSFLWSVAWVGGASTLGLLANANNYGLSAYWYVIATVLGYLIFAALLAPRIRMVGDKLNQVTFGDIIEDRYDVRCRIIASLVNISTSILFAASQIVAISYLLGLTGVLPRSAAVLLGTLLFAIYTARGGLIYISRLAYLQTLIIMLGSLTVIYYCFQGMQLKALWHTMPASSWNISAWGWDNIVVVFVSILCSVLSSSDGYMRCLAARDETASKTGLAGAALLTMLMTLGFLLMGLYSNFNFPGPLSSREIIDLLWSQLPAGIKGIFLVTLLAVILSTADISLMVATAGISRDVYNRFVDVTASQKVLLRVSYLAAVFAAVLAAVVAMAINDLFAIVMWAFKITAIGLTVPVVGAYFWSRGQAEGALYSMISSLVAAGLWSLSGLARTTGVSELWIGLTVSLFVYLAVSLLTPQTEECYRKSQAFCQVNDQATGSLVCKKTTHHHTP